MQKPPIRPCVQRVQRKMWSKTTRWKSLKKIMNQTLMWAATRTLDATRWPTQWRQTGQLIERTTKATASTWESTTTTIRRNSTRTRKSPFLRANRLSTALCTRRRLTKRLKYVEVVMFLRDSTKVLIISGVHSLVGCQTWISVTKGTSLSQFHLESVRIK